MATGHVEKRGKRGYTSMVIEHDPDPVTDVRKREREALDLAPGKDYMYKEDAEKILYARLTDLNRGTYVAPAPLTVAEHLRAYLLDCKSRNLRKTTLAGYGASIKKHLIPAFGETLRLTHLEPSHLRALHKQMLADGFAPRTVELAHVVLHGALGQALIDGKVIRNVADAVVPPRPRRNKIPRTLLPGEEAVLLAYIRPRDKAMYRLGALAVYTGLRRSELLAEEWSDVDLSNTCIAVTKGVTVTDGVYDLEEPKTEQSTRIVPLTKEAVELLREMKGEATCKLLFHNRSGGYLNPSTASKQFSRLAAEAGFPGITPKQLRHTFATNMLRAGVSIKYAQVLLGHSSIKTTGDIYAHVVDDDLRNAVNTYGKSLRKKTPAPTRHRSGTR